MTHHTSLEIERKYLLSGLPDMPGPVTLQLEQGYLAAPSSADLAPSGELIRNGRLRRTTHPDGRVVCHHTLKTGRGLVRKESERTISIEQFEQAWPRTRERRITKLRHEVREGEFVWQIDEIRFPVEIVLAEVELPRADMRVVPPDWLAKCVIREVTDDPAYTNSAIARHGLPS